MYNILHNIAISSGSLKKISLLKDNPVLQKVLKYTYDPYKHYYINDLPVDGLGHNIIDLKSFELLDILSSRQITGHTALRVVVNYVEALTFKDAIIFKRILNKDMRIGAGTKTINKAFPNLIPIFPIMKAHLWDPKKAVYPCYVSPKLMGIRGKFCNNKLHSRNGKVLESVEHINRAIKSYKKTEGGSDEFDGELMIPDINFEDSSGQLMGKKDRPTTIFHIFDSPSINKPLLFRLKYLIPDIYNRYIKRVPHILVDTEEEIMLAYNTFRQQGYEGLVVKNPASLYENKRSYDWLKIKDVIDEDLPIIGFYSGKKGKKYEHTLGGLLLDYKGVKVKAGSGFSDKLRYTIWNNQDDYLGRIAEILFQEPTKYKSLRHARFIRFRDDKHE